ncbi:MAG: hypothetical protein ACK59R_12195 [Pseudomonadota bacterium]|jgi:hypothetical protein
MAASRWQLFFPAFLGVLFLGSSLQAATRQYTHDSLDRPESASAQPGAQARGWNEATIEGPGWHSGRRAPVTPEEADAAMRARGAPPPIDAPAAAETGSEVGSADIAPGKGSRLPAVPETIADLASALKNDPDLIFQHVRDNISFCPKWGVHKGPEGALLDGAGTAFDQALLLRDLLRAAGFTADVVRGNIACCRSPKTDHPCASKIDQGWMPGSCPPGGALG